MRECLVSFSGERQLDAWKMAGSFARTRTDKESCFPGAPRLLILCIVEKGTAHVWKPEDSAGAHSLSSVWVLWTKLRSPGFETSIFYLSGHLASSLSFCAFYLLVCVHASVSVGARACRCLQKPEASIGCPGAVVIISERL